MLKSCLPLSDIYGPQEQPLLRNKNRLTSITPAELLRWSLGLAAVVIISLLYPNNLKFPYEFERGQTWRYESLYAPKDFSVLKSPEQLEADLAAVEEQLTPVFRIDPEIGRLARQEFLEDFNEKVDSAIARNTFPSIQADPKAHRLYGLRVLDKIFSRGILDAQPNTSPTQVVSIANGNEFREATWASVYTLADAQRFLTDSLPYSDLGAPDFILPLLDDRLRPNLSYSDSLTQHLRSQSLSLVSPYAGLVEAGSLIIADGSVITDEIYQQLLSFREQYNEDLGVGSTFTWVFAGYALLTSLVIILLFLYLRYFYPLIYKRPQKLIFILMWPVLYAILVQTIETKTNFNAYLVPFCIVPIVIRIFFAERLAFFVHTCVVLIGSFLTNLGYEFTFLSILAGIAVVIMDIDMRDWSRYFKSLIYLFGVYALGYLGLELIKEGRLSDLDFTTLGWLAIDVFLVLLAYPLIPLLERVFGLVSPITLVELSDMNRPLLRELALKAPGTLQHSLNVANMAEQAARRIDADALLVKTAALYHDIGKVANPEFFIENQSGKNPHDDLNNLESAKIIIGHVSEGVKMAKAAGLPQLLIQFIRTHHGNTRTEYFYRNYLKNHPENEVDESLFRYPGPRPISKEETLLMLADSTEAACKSLKSPTEEELTVFIDKIFEGKLTGGQLAESKLSFRELEVCRTVFRNILKSVHHVRISYPDSK
ncbi:hypothetical protein CEQ90_12285 [Lewinellaceae bacterium SD302]|nr:hypothetical protein CEQ90_12285 [Lewinellaceae bacterium SD302]